MVYDVTLTVCVNANVVGLIDFSVNVLGFPLKERYNISITVMTQDCINNFCRYMGTFIGLIKNSFCSTKIKFAGSYNIMYIYWLKTLFVSTILNLRHVCRVQWYRVDIS